MKKYPSVIYCNYNVLNKPIIAFDKLDGTQIVSEWTRKRGFSKFSTRREMINHRHHQWGEAVEIFLDKYADSLHNLFKSHKEYRELKNITVYCEYLGENSFSGRHNIDDDKDVILFDIWQHKKGWVEPRVFVNEFAEFGIPRVVYEGLLTNDFFRDVKNNIFGLREGVVAKGTQETKIVDERVWMVKLKTDDWFKKLRKVAGKETAEKEFAEVQIKL